MCHFIGKGANGFLCFRYGQRGNVFLRIMMLSRCELTLGATILKVSELHSYIVCLPDVAKMALRALHHRMMSVSEHAMEQIVA